MFGRYSSVVAFSVFLLLQFIQGVILNNYLRRETNDLRQWWWLLVDLSLLLCWGLLILYRRSQVVTKDMPVLPLPTMSAAWAVYLAIVFIPRVTWLMRAAGTCLGQSHHTSNSTGIGLESKFSDVAEFTQWEGNGMTTTFGIGTALMLVALAVAGYGQHGMLSSASPLDFDMAEAVFCIMDGVDFLSIFWEDDVISMCPTSPQVCNTTSEYLATKSPDERVLDSYICALHGGFGAVVIAVAVFSFVFPFLALWQFKRRSAVLKGDDVIKSQEGRLSKLTSERRMSLSVCGAFDRSNSASDVAQDTNSLQVCDRRPCLSVYHMDFVNYQRNMKTQEFMEKELEILAAVYVFWDLLMINLAGGIVRLILWFEYKRSISSLITKNALCVMFRSLNVANDYVIPWYKKRQGRGGSYDVSGQNGGPSDIHVDEVIPSVQAIMKAGGTLPRNSAGVNGTSIGPLLEEAAGEMPQPDSGDASSPATSTDGQLASKMPTEV